MVLSYRLGPAPHGLGTCLGQLGSQGVQSALALETSRGQLLGCGATAALAKGAAGAQRLDGPS